MALYKEVHLDKRSWLELAEEPRRGASGGPPRLRRVVAEVWVQLLAEVQVGRAQTGRGRCRHARPISTTEVA